MNTVEYSKAIVAELDRTLSRISVPDAEKLSNALLSAKKVLVGGAGRSGLAVKAFAMRLMHMGFDVYVVGETITPSLEPADLLVIGSGSGETGSLVAMAHKAKKIGPKLAVVTIFPESSIGRLADIAITIAAPTPKVENDSGVESIQPMGSLFEQSLLLFLDSMILRLMEKRGNNSNLMFTRHANLE